MARRGAGHAMSAPPPKGSQAARPDPRMLVIADLADRCGTAAEHAATPGRRGYYLALQAALDHCVSDEVRPGDEFNALLGFVHSALRNGPSARELL